MTAHNRVGGEMRPPIIYNESDPFVYCGFCQATFRTDPMDATCRLCGHFFRDMGHLGHSDASPLIKEINAIQAENARLREALEKANTDIRASWADGKTPLHWVVERNEEALSAGENKGKE